MSRLLTWERIFYVVIGTLALLYRYRETGDATELLIMIPVSIIGFELIIVVHRWKTKFMGDLSLLAHLRDRDRNLKRQPRDSQPE